MKQARYTMVPSKHVPEHTLSYYSVIEIKYILPQTTIQVIKDSFLLLPSRQNNIFCWSSNYFEYIPSTTDEINKIHYGT